ncbi:MAG: phosphoglycolate phosphatase [Pseudomonadota bacterium]
MPTYLFDLDGTLFDTAPDIADALDLTLAAIGLEPVGRELAQQWIGGGAIVLIDRALRHAVATHLSPDDVLPTFMDHYATTNARDAAPFPGVTETLEELIRRGRKLGCVTNKPERFAREILVKAGIAERFGVLIGGDTLPVRKPDALPLNSAMATLGATAGSTWMVGDSMTDMNAARAAGVKSAWVPFGYHQGATLAELDPTEALTEFTDLLEIDTR